MLGLEGVVDGECELLFPKLPMGGFRVRGCCRHPPKVGHDILVTEERLPVGRVMGSDDRGVILGAEPCPTVVGGGVEAVVDFSEEGGEDVGFLLIVVLWLFDSGDCMVCRHGAQSVGQIKTAGTPPWECPLHFWFD